MATDSPSRSVGVFAEVLLFSVAGRFVETVYVPTSERSTREFTWWRVDAVHPMTDVDGTADLITAFLAHNNTRSLP